MYATNWTDKATAFVITDPTANTGNNYIDDNGDNCIEENAEFFETKSAAVARVAQIDPEGNWARIEETDSHLLLVEAELEGRNLIATCPECGCVDGYVSTGEHAANGTDIVHCCNCGEVFKIDW